MKYESYYILHQFWVAKFFYCILIVGWMWLYTLYHAKLYAHEYNYELHFCAQFKLISVAQNKRLLYCLYSCCFNLIFTVIRKLSAVWLSLCALAVLVVEILYIWIFLQVWVSCHTVIHDWIYFNKVLIIQTWGTLHKKHTLLH